MASRWFWDVSTLMTDPLCNLAPAQRDLERADQDNLFGQLPRLIEADAVLAVSLQLRDLQQEPGDWMIQLRRLARAELIRLTREQPTGLDTRDEIVDLRRRARARVWAEILDSLHDSEV